MLNNQSYLVKMKTVQASIKDMFSQEIHYCCEKGQRSGRYSKRGFNSGTKAEIYGGMSRWWQPEWRRWRNPDSRTESAALSPGSAEVVKWPLSKALHLRGFSRASLRPNIEERAATLGRQLLRASGKHHNRKACCTWRFCCADSLPRYKMFGSNADVNILGANIPGKSAFKGFASGYRIFIFSCHRHPIFNAGLLPLTPLPLPLSSRSHSPRRLFLYFFCSCRVWVLFTLDCKRDFACVLLSHSVWVCAPGALSVVCV